jgi:hypothetical protein
MSKKSFFYLVSSVLLVLIFLLSSCSQAALTEQNQPGIKIADKVNSSRVIIESPDKRYYIIPFIREDKPGWDWCACSASCMMFLDPGCGWIDQSALYRLRWGGIDPGSNVLACIRSYKPYHGIAAYINVGMGAPSLEFIARNGFDNVHLIIDIRKDQYTGKLFTVVMYGYDLKNNMVAYWNPHNGISAWVDYHTFTSNLIEGGVTSYSDYMIGVIPQ